MQSLRVGVLTEEGLEQKGRGERAGLHGTDVAVAEGAERDRHAPRPLRE